MRHPRRPSLFLIISLEGTSLSSHPFPPSFQSQVKISHQIGRFPGSEEMAELCFGPSVRHWLFVWVLGAQQIFYSRPRLCVGRINTVITSAASKSPAINHVFLCEHGSTFLCIQGRVLLCSFNKNGPRPDPSEAGSALFFLGGLRDKPLNVVPSQRILNVGGAY